MNGTMLTVPAHFDGEQIRLDVEIELKANTPLLVTILPSQVGDTAAIEDVMRLSAAAFGRVWNNEEDAAYDDL